MGARKRVIRSAFGALAVAMLVLWYGSGDFEFHLSLGGEPYSTRLGFGPFSLVALLVSMGAIVVPNLILRSVDLEPVVIADSKSILKKYATVAVTVVTCFPAFFLWTLLLCLVVESFATGGIVTSLNRASFEMRDVAYQAIGILSLPAYFLWISLSRHGSKPLIGDVVCDIYIRRVEDERTFGSTVAREMKALFFFLATVLTLPVSLFSSRPFPMYDREHLFEPMRWKEC